MATVARLPGQARGRMTASRPRARGVARLQVAATAAQEVVLVRRRGALAMDSSQLSRRRLGRLVVAARGSLRIRVRTRRIRADRLPARGTRGSSRTARVRILGRVRRARATLRPDRDRGLDHLGRRLAASSSRAARRRQGRRGTGPASLRVRTTAPRLNRARTSLVRRQEAVRSSPTGTMRAATQRRGRAPMRRAAGSRRQPGKVPRRRMRATGRATPRAPLRETRSRVPRRRIPSRSATQTVQMRIRVPVRSRRPVRPARRGLTVERPRVLRPAVIHQRRIRQGHWPIRRFRSARVRAPRGRRCRSRPI